MHFEIPADNPERAVEFYKKVFGWQISKWEGSGDYWLAATGEKGEAGIDGAIMDRSGPKTTVNTIDVPALDDFIKKVKAAGGKTVGERQTIPGVGIFTYCEDTEGNLFGILQSERPAG